MSTSKKTAAEYKKLKTAGWCASSQYRGKWYEWAVYNPNKPVGSRRKYFTRADALKQIKKAGPQ